MTRNELLFHHHHHNNNNNDGNNYGNSNNNKYNDKINYSRYFFLDSVIFRPGFFIVLSWPNLTNLPFPIT